MDVDLLRPGTVPISPDTLLWFEFLLNPSLLKTHITKASPDPSPTELMIKFMSIAAEQKSEAKPADNNDTNDDHTLMPSSKWTCKQLALKILSLKIAAYLKWDWEYLQKKIPLVQQINLIQDLYYITLNLTVQVPNVPEIPLNNITDTGLFTVVIYHRWVLRAIVYKALSRYLNKPVTITPPNQEAHFAMLAQNEEIVKKLEAHVETSINTLNAVLQLTNLSPKVMSFDTFEMLTEHSSEIKQNWDNVITITEEEFKCQINYDLGVYWILKERYPEAQKHFLSAKNLYDNLDKSKEMCYCHIDKDTLEGFCIACDIQVEGKKPNLLHRLLMSIKDGYSNLIKILQEDNIMEEIPIVERDNLELDVKGSMENGKITVNQEFLLQIQCLNMVRRILAGEPILGDTANDIKMAGPKGLETLFWAYDGIIDKLTETTRTRVNQHFIYLIIISEIKGLASEILKRPKYSKLFNDEELEEIKKEAIPEELEIPKLLLTGKWDDSWSANVKLKAKPQRVLFSLESQLISSYDPQEIRDLIVEIGRHKRGPNIEPMWRINNHWEIPIPLQSVICSLSDGFLKDYAYILLAKSRELAGVKDFSGSINLINIIENEIQKHFKSLNDNRHYLGQGASQASKLLKLLNWEKLLIDIYHCLYYWPAKGICDTQSLTVQCKQCLESRQATDHVIPRMEIIDNCTVFLLNMSEWDYLMGLEKQWSCFELASALSTIAKFKGQKFPKEAWDIILASISTKPSRDQAQKRNSSNNGANSSSRDSMVSFTLLRLREATVLNVTISLLARMHNILRDESSLDLYAPFITHWPASIPNAKQYNTRTVGEHLFQLLTQGLRYYPHNVPWLRLLGDLNFVLGYYESSMKNYLLAIIVATDYFSVPSRGQIDDCVYRRMIKCCAHLQCFTQSVVLCQFLEEVDYTLAFKLAGTEQKTSVPNDAMDAYYECIWDTTILEYLINLHSKRGEHHRKQLAIKVIGLLELNSNNNDEIQKEAANIRKTKFLRALSKQYLFQT
ncbi:integrator complex subunit 8 [Trichogramma pretiosum]|uniref:integrator complex subunit 8 n=1 Tax=Trichogramma pretiosum TaxID=7493 RepID=UPI0006C9513E|nr:integrator complex subunit 8 [Trichogramma pretiosum]